jgi:TPP-dependent 2-oxoacid decarboxylase
VHETVTDPGRAPPGYLEIHRDMVDVPIPVPREIVEWDGSFPRPRSDPRKLDEAVSDTLARLRAARRPVLFGGVELFRSRADRAFRELAERIEVPVLTTVLAKGVFPMDHPLHLGIHMGPMSPPTIRRRVANADLVLALGTELTDLNLGAARPEVPRERAVWAIDGSVRVSFHQYTEVELHDFVCAGCARLPASARRCADNSSAAAGAPARAPLSVNDLLPEVNSLRGARRRHALASRATCSSAAWRCGCRRPGSTARRATTPRWASACPPPSARRSAPACGRSCSPATAHSR